MHRLWKFLIALLLIVQFRSLPTRADHWKIRNQTGSTEELDARLVCSAKGAHVLELPSGAYRLIPQGVVEMREVKEGPEALTAEQLAAGLAKEFPEDLTRKKANKTYAVVVVLGHPLAKTGEARVQNVLNKALAFMTTAESVFGSFCKQAKLEAQASRLPLGMLVFETDADFEKYAAGITKGTRLRTGQISGFYSGLTNLLALRLSECNTFEVPAHEAMHQQTYNRGLFQRLAPVPHWFDEGLATGFETVGGKISGSPFKVSTRYALQALDEQQDELGWNKLMKDDSVFGGGVLVGKAYGQAWGLHWLMLAKHKNGYSKYVKTLASKMPLQPDSPDERVKDFESAFGKQISDFEQEFIPTLNAMYERRKKPEVETSHQPGQLVINDGLADVEMFAVQDTGGENLLRVKGRLKNSSPIRSMTYHVTVETDGGAYADWLIPNAGINKIIALEPQVVQKKMQNAPEGRNSRTFKVKVQSVVPGTSEDENWRKGKVPVPSYE